MSNLTLILEWAQGSTEASNLLLDLNQESSYVTTTVLNKLLRNPSIRGKKLATLWVDLAEKDMSKLVKICEKVPDSILAEACAPEDASRKYMVEYCLEQKKQQA